MESSEISLSNSPRKEILWGRTIYVRNRTPQESAMNQIPNGSQDFAVRSVFTQNRISLSTQVSDQTERAACSMRDGASESGRTSRFRQCSDFFHMKPCHAMISALSFIPCLCYLWEVPRPRFLTGILSRQLEAGFSKQVCCKISTHYTHTK